MPSKKVYMVTKESVSLKSKFGERQLQLKHNTKLKLPVGQMLDQKNFFIFRT